jgi:hypothetical protein
MWSAAALVACIAAGSLAQAAPDESAKTAARGFMAEGRARRESNDLQAALESFRSADAIMHVPTTRLEVARTLASLGQLLEARETLEKILETRGDDREPPQFAEARAAAQTLREHLEKRIPTLHFSFKGVSAGDAPSVWADDALVPPTAYESGLNFNPGKHKIVAKMGNAEAKQVVQLTERQTREIVLDLSAASNGDDAVIPPVPVKPSVSPMVYVLASASVAAFGTAAVFAVIEKRRESQLESTCAPNCTEEDIDGAARMFPRINIALVAGGVTAAGAAVWYLAESASGARAAAPRPSLFASPLPLGVSPQPGGALVQYRGAF